MRSAYQLAAVLWICVFGPKAHLACSSFSSIRNVNPRLLWLQVLGDLGNNRVHQQFTGKSPINVANSNRSNASGRFSDWHQASSRDYCHALFRELAVGNASANGCKRGKKGLLTFGLQHLLQVRAAPPRRTATGTWGKLLQLSLHVRR